MMYLIKNNDKIGVSNGIFYTEKISDNTGSNKQDIIIIDDYTKKYTL